MSSKHQDLRLDQDELQELLLGSWAQDRLQVRKTMEDPFFHHQVNTTKEEQREQTLNQIQELADRKLIGKAYPKRFGGQENPGANVRSEERREGKGGRG